VHALAFSTYLPIFCFERAVAFDSVAVKAPSTIGNRVQIFGAATSSLFRRSTLSPSTNAATPNT
jgi:hypothetical protein